MMVKGEGGDINVKEGIARWEEAAAMDNEDDEDESATEIGVSNAKANLDMLHSWLGGAEFKRL